MRPFDHVAVSTVEQAVAALAARPGARVLAGGTDLLPLMRRDIEAPALLVSLAAVDELSTVCAQDGELSLGAGVRLSAVSQHPLVRDGHPLLAQAIAAVGTPQVRNRATLGGSLCQRPRCWYFRHPDFVCARRGGTGCPALQGQSRYHALFPSGGCAAVHPSDTATALVALDARVEIAGPSGRRQVALADFHLDPAQDITREHAAGPCEVVTRILLPPPRPGARALFGKAAERRAVDFALASVAVAVDVRHGTVSWARLVLGGVAARPLRLPRCEALLLGQPLSAQMRQRVCDAALEGTRPPRQAAHKAAVARGLLARALREIAAG